MRFASIRELRNQASTVWSRLENDEVVLTSKGRPVALMTKVDEEELEELLREIRLGKMRILVRRLQREARSAGSSGLTEGEIDEVIRNARSRRDQG